MRRCAAWTPGSARLKCRPKRRARWTAYDLCCRVCSLLAFAGRVSSLHLQLTHEIYAERLVVVTGSGSRPREPKSECFLRVLALARSRVLSASNGFSSNV